MANKNLEMTKAKRLAVESEFNGILYIDRNLEIQRIETCDRTLEKRRVDRLRMNLKIENQIMKNLKLYKGRLVSICKWRPFQSLNCTVYTDHIEVTSCGLQQKGAQMRVTLHVGEKLLERIKLQY